MKKIQLINPSEKTKETYRKVVQESKNKDDEKVEYVKEILSTKTMEDTL